ncbi:helix-turn-helix transcriptional regulator [Alicyclobacillus fodiniaquatilis]|uniref:Helix-turn-helix transcriptional regulator n=1 Tax=Alicyclobacillus fodiniaquatilis TaxID=1661150 RepID=A0ABW4JPE2_9BACL
MVMLNVNVEKLSDLLLERGWSQQRLAKELCVNPSYVSLVVNRRRNPSSRFVSGVLSAFPSVRFEELFKVS